MIYKKHDKDDKIEAYAIYHQLDITGNFNNDGEYIYVEDVWVHKDIRHKNIPNLMIQDVIPVYSDVKYIYWVRHKYNDRMKLYEIVRGERIKLIKKEIAYG